ncbi:MAG: hypothetical protein LZF86_80159 [Nitrospira sp.]|nr:MAG: hypothetical protein LZF86_80159 [Nitrospira sp.]
MYRISLLMSRAYWSVGRRCENGMTEKKLMAHMSAPVGGRCDSVGVGRRGKRSAPDRTQLLRPASCY